MLLVAAGLGWLNVLGDADNLAASRWSTLSVCRANGAAWPTARY